ncbi:hypothetical protein GJ699_21130 [Duganella sp. FT80W]|uniref:Pirin family protein n=1 Tax=Duganella guangzhouensis TaxID=2666084 RepID=A0A6I2L760_9BURK|nr:pirin family protein [Duganella guangzhouensis]MRW92506.1 hypothetical protein [Duganella guangzhouensis]
MILHRRWKTLDGKRLSWLRAKYHFRVHADGNPEHGALGPLLVWNDDEVAVGAGFAMHGHRDVEIVTYVRQGVLGHRDTLGSEGTLHAGDVQVMSAGSGIQHEEFNRGEVPLLIYQIWLQPRESGGAPAWATRSFPARHQHGQFTVLASGFADDSMALPLRAEARVLCATLQAGQQIRHPLGLARQAYLVVVTGAIEVDGEAMDALDGGVILGVDSTVIEAREDAEIIMVEVA